jgi:hypothetical protein
MQAARKSGFFIARHSCGLFFRPPIGVRVDYDDFWMIVEYLTKVIKFITEVPKLVELLKKLRKRK